MRGISESRALVERAHPLCWSEYINFVCIVYFGRSFLFCFAFLLLCGLSGFRHG